MILHNDENDMLRKGCCRCLYRGDCCNRQRAEKHCYKREKSQMLFFCEGLSDWSSIPVYMMLSDDYISPRRSKNQTFANSRSSGPKGEGQIGRASCRERE